MAGFAALLSAGAGAGATAGLTNAASFGLLEALGAGTAAGFNAASAAGATAAGAAGIGQILNLVGTGVSAGGQIISGQQSKVASKAEAAELERIAGEERAAGQRKAAEKRRQTTLLLSRSQAISAASGAGPTDPTVLANEGDIFQEGEYQAGVENYLGETRARGYQGKADLARQSGKDAVTTSMFSAAGDVLSGLYPRTRIGADGTILTGESAYFNRYGRKSGGALRYG